ncbi:MAG: hypothetical protein VR65_20765 [Desulfobulbaceae bacterium BRH_c16a]|nr:MAG: hypothetical protein VR65_20765 [Desulfobulbaceae bacterium BRH_c16a]
MKVRITPSVIFIIMLGMLLSGCEKEQTGTGENLQTLPTAEVTVGKVEKRIAENQVEIVGTVQAVVQAEISAKISGNIVAMPVDLGSRVKQGELLVEISAGEISAQVQQAKAQLEQARRNLLREENLLKKNAATPEMVKSLQDSARIAEAAYRETITMLEYARVTAPFTGIVTRKHANIGDLATPGKPLLNIEAENNLQVLTDIPEAMILQINKGDRLKVFVPSVGLTVEGTVAEVSPTADPSSRTAPIKLRIPADEKLRSGQFARVTLAMAQAETLTVPAAAVVSFGQMQKVFVVIDGKARLRLVRTGAQGDDYIEILSGLEEEETVVAGGNHMLLDGQPVIVQ